MKEETGLNVDTEKPLHYNIELYDLKIFAYLVKPKDSTQQVTLNYEASEWGWFTKEEALKLDLYGDTEQIIEEAVKNI